MPLRPAAAGYGDDAGLVARAGRKSAPEIVRQRDLLAINVRDGEVSDPIVIHEIDRVPVGDRRNDQIAKLAECGLVVERCAQDLAGSGQTPDPIRFILAGGILRPRG